MSAVTAVFRMIIAFFVMLPNILSPLVPMLKQSSYFEYWSAEQTYTEDYAVVLQKDPNKDFVVLNLTDIHFGDADFYGENGEDFKALVNNLITEAKPDLITLSGDNVYTSLAYVSVVDFIDSLGIPWAPVMGNHDGEGTIGEFWCAYQFYNAENCLWKFGPNDMGYGNYIINIEENGKIVHTLFMMDTHSYVDYTDKSGIHIEGYDHLWDNQIEWYKWAINGIEATEGNKVESSVIIHIPVYEVKTVWESNYDKETDTFTGEYAGNSYGVIHESPCPGAVNNGFMDVVTELDSTKNIIFGHDHINNASILYNGVRLTYSMKTGKASSSYWDAALQGGTTLTIASNGNATVEHINYGA